MNFSDGEFDWGKAKSPATKLELYFVARRIGLVIAASRRLTLCLANHDAEGAQSAVTDLERFDAELSSELVALLSIEKGEGGVDGS